MVPPPVSRELFGVVGDLNAIDRSGDAYTLAASLWVTSLVFLMPAFAAWRMGRIWHAWIFAVMSVISVVHHCFGTGALSAAQREASPNQLLVTQAYQMWSFFCMLQTAFVVLGPEDANMHSCKDSHDGRAGMGEPMKAFAPPGAMGLVPMDVVIVCRVLPAVALFFFHFFHVSVAIDGVQWDSILLNEMLLLFCTAAFWMHHTRRNRASDVLLRFRYWHRFLHHGFIPALMLFWIYCIMGVADSKAMRCMWHTVVASFAVSILRTVNGGETSALSTTRVLDSSHHNPIVAHILLGSVALIVIPTALAGASLDWCSTGAWQWPTISLATSCQPGGYFVAIASLPAFLAAAAVFWLIESTATNKELWSRNMDKPWERQEDDRRQLALSRRLGCLLGYGGVALGMAACLIMKGSPAQNVTSLFCSLVSIILLMVAMSLIVLSSESSELGFHLRQRVTMFVCMPLLSLQVMLLLLDQCLPSKYVIPHSAYALTEYAVVLLLALWPLTWMAEVQDIWQRKSQGDFSWPSTSWRLF